jgi:hypothetical protein
VDSANLTFDGTNLTLGGGTANGVAYLNGSKVLTTGSALTFDGSRLTVKGGNAGQFVLDNSNEQYVQQIFQRNGTANTGADFLFDGSASTFNIRTLAVAPIVFSVATSPGTSVEQMRLTSTGLGIGTSSPAGLFEVNRASDADSVAFITARGGNAKSAAVLFRTNTAGGSGTGGGIGHNGSQLILHAAGATLGTQFVLDSSGNLGLGVTPSGSWEPAVKAIQISNAGQYLASGSTTFSGANQFWLGNNGYLNSSGQWIYLRSVGASQYRQFNNEHAWYTAPSGTAGNAISFTQAMTLDASGNLGVGTTSPTARLHVLTGSTYAANFYTTNTGAGTTRIAIGGLTTGASGGGGSAAIGAEHNHGATAQSSLTFYTHDGSNLLERARITSGGNLLVGTTNDSMAGLSGIRLGAGNAGIVLAEGGANRGYLFHSTIGSSISLESVSGTTIKAISGSGGVSLANGATSWAAISDKRLKTAVTPFEGALQKVCTLRAGTGRYLSDAESVSRSFLVAQDVQAILPEAVDVEADEQGTLSLRYTDTIPLLVAAIQELKAEFDAYKASHP